MVYRSLVRPILFRLPPETAHELALHSLSLFPPRLLAQRVPGRQLAARVIAAEITKANAGLIRERSPVGDERGLGAPASDRPSWNRTIIHLIHRLHRLFCSNRCNRWIKISSRPLRESSLLVSIRAHGFSREGSHHGC